MIFVNNIQKIVARTQSGIHKPEDLKNKKVGLYNGTTSEFFLDNFLLEHNIDKSSIELVNIDVTNQLHAFREGEVDVVVTWEPHASKILAEMGERAKKLNTMIDHSTLWLAVTSQSYATRNSGTIKAYLQALKQAQSYIKKHPDETKKLLADKTDVSNEIIKNLWPSIEYELSLGERMLILLEDQHRWLRYKGYFERDREPLNLKETIYFKAMEDIYPRGITIRR